MTLTTLEVAQLPRTGSPSQVKYQGGNVGLGGGAGQLTHAKYGIGVFFWGGGSEVLSRAQ